MLGSGSSRTRTTSGGSCLRRQELIYVDRPLRVWLREGGCVGPKEDTLRQPDNPTSDNPTIKENTTKAKPERTSKR